MNKFVGVAFPFTAPFVVLRTGAAKTATAALPGVFHPLETDVPVGIFEGFADGVSPVGVLGAVDGAARQESGQLRDGHSVELVLKDVVHPLLPVGNLFLQPLVESLGDLPQEDAGLTGRIEKRGFPVAPEIFRQQVEDAVYKRRRREDLVAAQVGDAGENIGVVVMAEHGGSPGSGSGGTP